MFTRNSDSDNAETQGQRTENLQRPQSKTPPKPGNAPRETVISNDLTIEGNVQSEGTVRLEGTIVGDMNCASLIVENSGSISGNIDAAEVNVHGRVEGTVHGQNVMLHSNAFVEGDIYHQGIGIEMGTHYDGRLKWVDNIEDLKTPPSNETKKPVAANILPHSIAAE